MCSLCVLCVERVWGLAWVWPLLPLVWLLSPAFPGPFSGLLATPAARKGIDDRHAGMGHVGDVARGDGHSVGEGGGGNLGVEVGPSPALYLSMTLPTSPRALSGLQALARMRTVGPLPGSSVQSLKSGEQ